ncbi:hypothetical protein B0J12DRAFT_746512 [Macrophomina phaseolina]|uniref:Uncharacterized protein n=1 Tax=Macrophomina phaseolina TaxID=35725 RepID=A0ABQ8FSD6_9PEZI|nr:hypothetical protein B0J12DRAFT_746512 [Macrophomina phaseolina]
MSRLRGPPPPTAGAKKRPAPLAVAPRKKVPQNAVNRRSINVTLARPRTEEAGDVEDVGNEEEKQKDDQDKDDKDDDKNDEENEDDAADIFPAKGIVDARKWQYLVTRENEKTGKVIKNPWVSKGSVSEGLVEAWNKPKAKELEKPKKLATYVLSLTRCFYHYWH